MNGENIPRCVRDMPCRGCFGQIRSDANPMVDMMNALSSIGLDAKLVDDRRTFNRYIGGQKRLDLCQQQEGDKNGKQVIIQPVSRVKDMQK